MVTLENNVRDWRGGKEKKNFQMPLIVTKWWYFIIIVQFLRFLTVAQAVWFGCGFAFCILTGLTDRRRWTDGQTICLFAVSTLFIRFGLTLTEPWVHWWIPPSPRRLFMTQSKSSPVAIWLPTWFTSDLLSFTYCVREAFLTLTLPFREETSCGFRLWCVLQL